MTMTIARMLPVALCLVMGSVDVSGADVDAPYRGRFTPDAEYVLCGQLHRDLPPLPAVPYDFNAPGFAANRLSKVPAPGVHPRVVLSPEDLERIRETYRRGKDAPAVFRITIEDMRHKAGNKTPYLPTFSNAPWLGVNTMTCRMILAHLDDDEQAGREAVKRVMEHARFLSPLVDLINTSEGAKAWKDNFYYFSRTSVRVGGIPYTEAYHKGGEALVQELAKKSLEFFLSDMQYAYTQLGMEYDYGHRFMTDEERAYIRSVISRTTKGKYTTGMELPGHMFINNHMSMGAEFLPLVLSIEGEKGYDPRILREYTPRLVDKMTYDISPDGVLFENVKGFIPIYPIWAAGRRGERNLLRHSHLLAMMTAKVQNTQNLHGRYIGRVARRPGWRMPEVGEGQDEARYWTVGTGSGPGGDASFFWNWLIRYLYPENQVVDYAYHVTLATQNFDCIDPEEIDGAHVSRTIHYNMRSMSDLMLLTSCQDDGVVIANPDKLPDHITDLPLGWSDMRRGLAVARSSWDKDAAFIHYECRSDTYHGGHETPEYGDFTLSADGVLWSPYTGAYMDCYFRNMVLIDGMAGMYAHALGKMVSVHNNEDGATFVSDATHGYNWRVCGGIWEHDHPCLDTPFLSPFAGGGFNASRTTEISPNPVMREFYEGFGHLDWGPWHGENRGPIRLEQWNQVDHVFRTLHMARGEHPYILICDDVKKDDKVHQFDWCLNLIGEAELAKADSNARNRHLEKGAKGTIQADLLLTIGDVARKRENTWLFGSTIPRITPDPKEGDPMLLVRVLWRNTNYAYPLPSFEEAWQFKRVKIPALAVDPAFKIMLYPHRHGDPLPFTQWNDQKTQLTVRIDDQSDVYTFSKTDRDRTVFTRERGTTPVNRSEERPPTPAWLSQARWTGDENDPNWVRTVLFDTSARVELGIPAVGTSLFYTLDGTMPNQDSPRYTGPFEVSRSVELRARAYEPDWPFGSDPLSEPLVVKFEKQKASPAMTPPQGTVPGLSCDVFEIRHGLYDETGRFTGKKNMLPDLGAFDPLAEILTGGFEIPHVAPAAPISDSSTGFFRYRGYLSVPDTGRYSFKVNSCAPVRLTVGGRSVMNIVLPFGLSQKDRYGEVVLAAGLHAFELIVTDPVFWKGEMEEPYQIAVAMLSPGDETYAPIKASMLSTLPGARISPSPIEPVALSPVSTADLPPLTRGLAQYNYDRVSQAPSDARIPFVGLSPALLNTTGEEAYAVGVVREPKHNGYLGRLVEYQGYLQIELPGVYGFQLDRDGANQLMIGGRVVANNRLAGRGRPGLVKLSAGTYPVRLSIAKGSAACHVKGPQSSSFEPIPMGAWYRPAKVEPYDNPAPVLSIPGVLNADGEVEFTAKGEDTVVRIQGASPAEGHRGPAINFTETSSRMTVEGLHMPEDRATLAMWVKPTKPGEHYLLDIQNLGIYLRLRKERIAAGFYRDEIAATGELVKPGEWTHIAVRYGDTVDVFVDGELATSVIASKASHKSTCHNRGMIFFGELADRFAFDGMFQHLRVYNRLLSEKEINDVMAPK